MSGRVQFFPGVACSVGMMIQGGLILALLIAYAYSEE
jgi:prolipoprotein diacylglyceryltransferase